MTIHSVQYVNASEIFKDNRPVWDAFFENDPDFSWGNNNHTLASRDMMIFELKRIEDDEVPGIEAMIDVLSTLDVETFIDLES